jgi:hypothetical protein
MSSLPTGENYAINTPNMCSGIILGSRSRTSTALVAEASALQILGGNISSPRAECIVQNISPHRRTIVLNISPFHPPHSIVYLPNKTFKTVVETLY